MLWAGIIFCGIALAHLDDTTPSHVRLGWAALAIGLVCLVMGCLRKEEL